MPAYFIEAMKELGTDKSHKFVAVRDRIKKPMSTSETKRADATRRIRPPFLIRWAMPEAARARL